MFKKTDLAATDLAPCDRVFVRRRCQYFDGRLCVETALRVCVRAQGPSTDYVLFRIFVLFCFVLAQLVAPPSKSRYELSQA